MTERQYTRQQVAELLGVTYTSVKRYQEAGRLTPSQVIDRGSRNEYRFSEEEVARLKEELAQQATVMLNDCSHLERENEMLQRENEAIREQLDRERSLVDRLLGAEAAKAHR